MKKLVYVFALMLLLTGAGCASSSVDQSSPEAVVESYFALFADKPSAALQVVDPSVQSSDRFERKWDEIKTWSYTSYSILEVSDNEVEVEMEIEIDGDMDSGTDQFGVEEVDGVWWITDIPS